MKAILVLLLFVMTTVRFIHTDLIPKHFQEIDFAQPVEIGGDERNTRVKRAHFCRPKPKCVFATGIIWKNCADYCQKCKGRAGGHCEKVYDKECSGGYQCRCAGPDRPKSKNPLDIATCKLGL